MAYLLSDLSRCSNLWNVSWIEERVFSLSFFPLFWKNSDWLFLFFPSLHLMCICWSGGTTCLYMYVSHCLGYKIRGVKGGCKSETFSFWPLLWRKGIMIWMGRCLFNEIFLFRKFCLWFFCLSLRPAMICLLFDFEKSWQK